jgi:hypothetical protein
MEGKGVGKCTVQPWRCLRSYSHGCCVCLIKLWARRGLPRRNPAKLSYLLLPLHFSGSTSFSSSFASPESFAVSTLHRNVPDSGLDTPRRAVLPARRQPCPSQYLSENYPPSSSADRAFTHNVYQATTPLSNELTSAKSCCLLVSWMRWSSGHCLGHWYPACHWTILGTTKSSPVARTHVDVQLCSSACVESQQCHNSVSLLAWYGLAETFKPRQPCHMR